MKDKKFFDDLYQCEVVPRERRQTVDREFYTLLKFLPEYSTQVGKQHLYLEKNKNDLPDFLVVDSQSNKIGIEVTEAPLSVEYSYERKGKEKFVKILEDQLQHCSYAISIQERPRWSLLNKHSSRIKMWLHEELQRTRESLSAGRKEYIEFPSLNFRILVRKSKQPIIFYVSGEGNSKEREENQELCNISICATIDNKLKRPKPSVRPCILAIYPNNGLFNIDYQEVKSNVASLVGFQNVKAHFEEVICYWRKEDCQDILVG